MLFAFSMQANAHGTVDTLGGAKTVGAEESATTGSGSTIKNVTPKPSRAKVKYVDSIGKDLDGVEFTTTTTFVGTDAILDMTDVNSNDTINVNGKHTVVDIIGEGCTVDLNAKSYDLSITNTGNVDLKDPTKNGPDIIVSLPSGATLTVPAGSSITLKS
jgi:hypothetical protein